MKGKIDWPNDFELFEHEKYDVFLWDADGRVIPEVKEAIYLKPLYSHLFFNEDLYCIVWWNDELGYWCAELYVHWDYVVTYICETLEELRAEVVEDYIDF